MLEQFVKDAFHGRDPRPQQRRRVRRKEWQGGGVMNRLQPPLLVPSIPSRGGCRGFESEEEKEPEQDGEKWWKESSFSLVFVSHYSNLF